MFVKQLPRDVHSMLCASMKINSYKAAVEELVYNSLDADSTSIAIRIHIKENSIQAIDNGKGIQKIDMNYVGQRYMTSRFTNVSALKSVPDKYGLSGESLANMIEVSQFVSITSRYKDTEDTWMKIFNESKGHKVNKTIERPSKGTTVYIKGFLYNRNIQRKSINELNELQEIKIFLEHISLLHSNISLSLRDDAKNLIILQLHKKRDIYQTLSNIYNIEKGDFKELKVEKHQFKVDAYIGVTSKDIRKDCIFLNKKLVCTDSQLHNIINNNLNRNLKSRNKIIKAKADGNEFENCIPDKYFPFYFMFIECPRIDYIMSHNGLEFKSWNQITELLEKLTKFYIGNIDVKEVKTTAIKQKLNTREQIKEIMTKILGNNVKRVETFQMQNGVKGKISKRKIKKKNKPIKLSLSNIKKQITATTSTSNGCVNNINIRNSSFNPLNFKKCGISKNSVICQTTINKRCNTLHPNKNKANIQNKKEKEDIEIKKNGPRKMNSRNLKRTKISKNQKKSISCIEKINKKSINTKDSIKKSYVAIPQKVRTFLDPKDKNMKTQETIQHENTTEIFQNDFYKRFEGNFPLNTKKSCIYDKINFNQNKLNYHQNISILFSPLKTTYDLIKTVMINENEKEDVKQNFKKIEINSVNRENTQLMSIVTFDSHKYDKHEFIRNSPRVNYHVLNRTYKKKEIVPKLRSTNNNMRLNINNNKKRNDFTIKHSMINNIKEISYITEFSKYNQNKYCKKFDLVSEVQNKTTLYTDNASSNIKKICETIYIQTKDGNFKNKNSSKVTNENYKSKECIYNSEELNSSLRYKHSKSDDNNPEENLNKGISRNKFQFSNDKDPIIEPINICETILGSEDMFESEITENFNSKSFHCDILQNTNINISRYFTNIHDSIKIGGGGSNEINYKLGATIRNDTLCSNINKNDQITDPVQDNLKKYQSSDKDCHENVIATDFKDFSLKNRLRFVPKGMSPIFFNCNTKYICDYLGKDYYEKTFYNNFINEVHINSEIFNPLLFNIKDIGGKVNEKLQVEMHKDNAALKFDDRSLKNAKVLGQVDEKFIASIMKSKNNLSTLKFLVLFDQHAVHERIRTEKNLSDYIENKHWKSVKVEKINMILSVDDIVYLHNYKDKFEELGLQFTIINSEEISIDAVPKAILGHNLREMDKIIKAVRNVILEEINIIKTQRGCISTYPKSIMELIFSEACRYAIKFGDKLTKNDCTQLIKDLSNCKIPFQCAHGRPVMAVIMYINSEEQEYKVDFTKLKEFKSKYRL